MGKLLDSDANPVGVIFCWCERRVSFTHSHFGLFLFREAMVDEKLQNSRLQAHKTSVSNGLLGQ